MRSAKRRRTLPNQLLTFGLHQKSTGFQKHKKPHVELRRPIVTI